MVAWGVSAPALLPGTDDRVMPNWTSWMKYCRTSEIFSRSDTESEAFWGCSINDLGGSESKGKRVGFVSAPQLDQIGKVNDLIDCGSSFGRKEGGPASCTFIVGCSFPIVHLAHCTGIYLPLATRLWRDPMRNPRASYFKWATHSIAFIHKSNSLSSKTGQLALSYWVLVAPLLFTPLY